MGDKEASFWASADEKHKTQKKGYNKSKTSTQHEAKNNNDIQEQERKCRLAAKTRNMKRTTVSSSLTSTGNGTLYILPCLPYRPSHGTVTGTVRRERDPEGWLQGNKGTDDEEATSIYCNTVTVIIPILPVLRFVVRRRKD